MLMKLITFDDKVLQQNGINYYSLSVITIIDQERETAFAVNCYIFRDDFSKYFLVHANFMSHVQTHVWNLLAE